MKLQLKSSQRLLLLGLACALAGSANAAVPTLFEPLSYVTRASTNAVQQPALGRLLASPSSVGVQLLKVDAAATDATELQFELQGQRVDAVLGKLEKLPDGSRVWSGNLRDASLATSSLAAKKTLSGVDPMNSVVLVRSGDKLTGSIRRDGKLYRLRPVGAAGHALVEVDESRMPAEHPASYDLLQGTPVAADRVSPAAASSGKATTIRVLVVATDEAVAAYGGDMKALAELAVAESNQGYANSKVGLTMELAGYRTTDYAETGDFDTDLGRFRGKNDGYMDEIHAVRDSTKADVAMIVLNNASYCGLASDIGSKALRHRLLQLRP
jgi:hypothetical protein